MRTTLRPRTATRRPLLLHLLVAGLLVSSPAPVFCAGAVFLDRGVEPSQKSATPGHPAAPDDRDPQTGIHRLALSQRGVLELNYRIASPKELTAGHGREDVVVPAAPPSQSEDRLLSLEEDQSYSFTTNLAEILVKMQDLYRGGVGGGSAAGKAPAFVKLKWELVAATEGRPGVQPIGETSDPAGVFPIVFPTPTDPRDPLVLVARAVFRWSVVDLTGEEHGNEADQILARVRIRVLDKTPPSVVGFDPTVILGTTGDNPSEFNQFKKLRGLDAVPDNPEVWNLIAIDNNEFGGAPTAGVWHDAKNVNALVYAEAFVSHYKADRPDRKPSRIEEAVGEFAVGAPLRSGSSGPPFEGHGRFVWLGPVDLRRDLEAAPRVAPYQAQGNPEARVAYIWTVPLKKLETALLADLNRRLPATLGTPPRPNLLDFHFATRAGFEFVDPAASVAHTLARVERSDETGRSFVLDQAEVLRITAAVSDSSGNWAIPSSPTGNAGDGTLLDHDPQLDMAALAALPEFETEGGKKFKHRAVVGHAFIGSFVVLDNDKPNGIVAVTNTANGATTRFTVPNSDLTPLATGGISGPWFDDRLVWEFDAEGESETMKHLAAVDQARGAQGAGLFEAFKQALTVEEGVRLMFEVQAWDNVNGWTISPGGTDGKGLHVFGITGEWVGERDKPDSLHPNTWKIIDESFPDSEFLFLDPAKKTYAYPDYAFRKSEAGKTYGVGVLLADQSDWNDPAKNQGFQRNLRSINLKFKVVPKGVSIRNLGGKETLEKK